jgi:hypothetical protein
MGIRDSYDDRYAIETIRIGAIYSETTQRLDFAEIKSSGVCG